MCTFTCVECGEELPARQLANECLEQAETSNPINAIMRLPEDLLICKECEVEDRLYSVDFNEGELCGRTTAEQWLFSGVTLDPGQLQAYLNSY